ncbi:MAG: aminoacyl-tRNA hydrolase [Clostridiaceae bacterium]|nr:aminoacyl-tRNA hydrolase [Clostridiaceae bacterium]
MIRKIFGNTSGENTYVVIGLGNIGDEYANTRHNMGFMAIDVLAERLGINVSRRKYQGYYGEGRHEGKKVVLVKPATYMNRSSDCVAGFLNRYKISLDRLIVIYDDVDIKAGSVRVRAKGSAGSHNGMRSVLKATGSEEFPRIRIGIGKNPPDMDIVQYVLGRIGKEEASTLQKGIEKAAEAVLLIMSEGIERAMNICNQN